MFGGSFYSDRIRLPTIPTEFFLSSVACTETATSKANSGFLCCANEKNHPSISGKTVITDLPPRVGGVSRNETWRPTKAPGSDGWFFSKWKLTTTPPSMKLNHGMVGSLPHYRKLETSKTEKPLIKVAMCCEITGVGRSSFRCLNVMFPGGLVRGRTKR